MSTPADYALWVFALVLLPAILALWIVRWLARRFQGQNLLIFFAVAVLSFIQGAMFLLCMVISQFALDGQLGRSSPRLARLAYRISGALLHPGVVTGPRLGVRALDFDFGLYSAAACLLLLLWYRLNIPRSRA